METWADVLKRIQELRGFTISEIARDFGVPYVTVWRWAKGGGSPESEEHRRRLLALAEMPSGPQVVEWPASRIKALRKRMKLTQQDLSYLVGVGRPAVGHWETDRGHPGTCPALFLSMLEASPITAFSILSFAQADRGAWTAGRIERMRERLGWSRLEMSKILDMPYRTIEDLEIYGLPEHAEWRGCIKMLLSLLEDGNPEFLEFLQLPH